MESLADNIDRLCSLRSCDWALEMEALLNRFVVVLWWNGESAKDRPDKSWVTISFERPASRAALDYGQMWQHSPDCDEAMVLTIREHSDGGTHLDGLTLNLESRPDVWISARICAQCDVIDVVSSEMPFVSFHNSEPKLIGWWNQGFNFDT